MSVFDGSAPVADHAVLCRLTHGMTTDLWTPYIPLVWVTNLQVYRESVALSYGIGAFGHGNYGGSGTETIGFPTPAIDVGSFSADSEEYTERASIALVQANEKSYYFDQTNQLLYVQFGNGTKPSLHAAKLVGMLLYYSNKEIDVDNRHYASKIIELSGIKKTKDSLDFGVQEFPEGSVSFINLDGEFDSVKERFFMYGAIIEFFLGIVGTAFSDFRQMYKGYVGEFNSDREQAKWSIFDERKKLSREIPYNLFNQTTWPYLNESHIGEYIPWAFGPCRRIPCVCVNEDESTPASYKFCIVDCSDHPDGIQEVTTVWSNDVEVTPLSIQLTPDSNGIAFFTLSTSDYKPGKKVFATIIGFDGDTADWNNPIKLEQHLLEDISGIEYNSDNFDTDEWEAAQAAALAQDVGRFIDERISVKDLIEEIQKSIMGTFFLKDNGKITNRIYDADRAVSGTLVKEERFEGPSISYDTTIATSIIVEYSKRYDTDKYKSEVYNTEEAEYAGLYKKYEPRSFETLLTTASDAAVLALALFNYLKDEHRLISMTVPWQGIGIELCDMYYFPIERISATVPELVKCEITEVEKGILEGEINLIGREVI